MNTNENNTQGRASYTEAERRELIQEFRSADLTQAAFCREWNINPKTMARWLRVERDESAAMSFCEVELKNESSLRTDVRVCLPNGIEVVMKIDSPSALGDLLRGAATCLD